MQTGASLGRPPPAHSLHAHEDAAARGLAPLRMPLLQPAAPSLGLPQAPSASGADHRDGGDCAGADPCVVDAVDPGEGAGGHSVWSDGDDGGGGGGGGGWSDADDYGGGGGGDWSDREPEELQEAAQADPGSDPGSDPGFDEDEDQENRASQGNQGAPQPRAAPAASGGTSRRTGESPLCDGGPGSMVGGTHGWHSGAARDSPHGAQASAPGTAAAAPPAAAKEDPAKRRVKRGHAQRNSLTGTRDPWEVEIKRALCSNRSRYISAA